MAIAALLTVVMLMDASSTVLKLAGKHIPIPVIVLSLIAAIVLAVAIVRVLRRRENANTLALIGSGLSALIGLIGIFAAPSAPTKTGNGLLFLLGLAGVALLKRTAARTA